MHKATRILAGLVMLGAGSALAQGWKPERPVEFLVGTSPGGTIDRTARSAHAILQEKGILTGSVVNRPGAGGLLAYQAVMNGQPHQVVFGSLTMLTNHLTGKGKIGHTDLTPIAHLLSEYVTFSVRTESPVKTARDALDALRKDPGGLSFAVASALGGSNHIAAGMVIRALKGDVRKAKFVVFNSSGDSVTNVLGGHVDVVASSASTLIPHVQAGKLRMVAVAAPKRMGGALAEVPTWRELGVDAVFSNFFNVLGPKNLDAAQIAYWDGVFAQLVKTPEWNQTLDKYLWVNEYMASKDARAYLDKSYAELKGILADLGVTK